MQQTGRVMAPGPLFVVSMTRSGSSLLYALLNKHPQVALMFEGDLVILRPVFLKPSPLCDWADRWEFFNQVFQRHKRNPCASNKNADFRSAFTVSYQSFARGKGATIWGDKSPNYYDCLNRMADVFPDGRFIIVWRNPRDTANAILRAASGGSKYFRRRGAVLRQLLGYNVLKKECDQLLRRGKPVCQISFEDLVSDTCSVMRNVCNFLQIPYDDSLSKLEGADRSAIYEAPHHAFVRGNKIVQESRPDHVSHELKTKIDQYVALWHKKYGPEWPPYPEFDGTNTKLISLTSRIRDSSLYRMLRFRDRMETIAFCFAPLSFLRLYRRVAKHAP